MSATEDLVYTQTDMDTVLAKLRAAEKEIEHSHQLLWAAVTTAGGQVQIPHRLWIEMGSATLTFRDDVENYVIHVQAK